jgi:hypothetical protein
MTGEHVADAKLMGRGPGGLALHACLPLCQLAARLPHRAV